MIIGYNVPDMTHLRYYVPLVNAIRRVAPDVEHEFVVMTGTHKYNSVCRPVNSARYAEITDGLCRSVFKQSVEKYDVLFTVEGYDCGLSGTKTYAIQHGFDYRGSASGCPAETIHIMSAQEYADDLQLRNPGRRAVVSPLPISVWELDWTSSDFLNSTRRATIFYPENGLHVLVRSVIKDLQQRGWQVHVKQRSKNQSVPDIGVGVHYDRDWYPSESIYLPGMSDVCIGFGTSAYTDLVPAGINFVDVPVPDYSREYIKPKHPCMVVLNPSALAEQIVEAAVQCQRIQVPVDVEAIDGFVRGLL